MRTRPSRRQAPAWVRTLARRRARATLGGTPFGRTVFGRTVFGLGALVLGATLLAGCGSEAANAQVAPPIADCTTGWECAARVQLPQVPPEEAEGLHQVYHLSENVISGAEPHGEAAIARIAAMGVKTLLSVDGKVPEAALARKYGMRYVHVPIRYSGITSTQLLRIAKTFRELPGPFFVHCFHGKHRGPAGAAVGRLVLDGATREQALAEMRQWCGTAEKYEGLFDTIAAGAIPTAAETRAHAWGFDEARPIEGIRAGMVTMTRTFDEIKALYARDWQVDPAHPDVDAVNESEKLAQFFERFHALKDTTRRDEDYRTWMNESVDETRALHAALVRLKNGDAAAEGEADEHYSVISSRCAACHTPYRNR